MSASQEPRKAPPLQEQFGRKSAAWESDTAPIVSFCVGDDVVGFPFFQLAAAKYTAAEQTLVLQFSGAIIEIQGPKVLDFYKDFCRQEATWVRVDDKDIMSVKLFAVERQEAGSE